MAHHQFEGIQRFNRSAFERDFQRFLHHHLPHQRSRIGHRKQFDDRLHIIRELPNRHVHPGKEADDGAKNRAGSRESVLAIEERGQKIDHCTTRQHGEQDQAEHLQYGERSQQFPTIQEDISFGQHERDKTHDEANHHRTQDIGSRQPARTDRRDRKVLQYFIGPVIDHDGECPHGRRDPGNRNDTGHDPTVHDVLRAYRIPQSARQIFTQEKDVESDDDQHRQQGKEDIRLIPEKYFDVAPNDRYHSCTCFPVIAIKASSMEPATTSK